MAVETLANLQVGDEVLFVFQVTSVDPTNGIGLNLYGPSSTLAATGVIATTGALTGQLADVPANIPVNLVQGYSPVTVGDVLQDADGNTFVVMWNEIQPNGEMFWSNSPTATVKYPVRGYQVVGHVTL